VELKKPILRIWSIVALAVTLAGAIFFGPRYFDQPPRGEGSYRAADRILRELAEIKGRNPADALPIGYHRFTYDDGSWYVAVGTDSHSEPDGGTLGILTSDGDMGVFFTHVCGGGEMPVLFFDKSPREVIEARRRTMKEFKRP